MGRAKKFDRDEVIDWAMNEIWSSGFESLSVKAVSEKLGITRSSFYHSFESLDVLFLEAMERYFQQSPHAKLSRFESSDSPLALLTQVFRETCAARSTDPQHRGCMAVNSVSELVGVNDKLGPIIAHAVHDSINCIEALLESSIKKGELTTTIEPRQLALALQSTLMGLNTMSKIEIHEQELWGAIKNTLIALNVYRD